VAVLAVYPLRWNKKGRDNLFVTGT